MSKKWFVLLLVLLIVLGTGSATFAATTRTTLSISGEGLIEGTDYYYDINIVKRILFVKTTKPVTITSSESTYYQDVLAIDPGTGNTAHVTLDNVTMDQIGNTAFAREQAGIALRSGSAEITLVGDNSLYT